MIHKKIAISYTNPTARIAQASFRVMTPDRVVNRSGLPATTRPWFRQGASGKIPAVHTSNQPTRTTATSISISNVGLFSFGDDDGDDDVEPENH